MFKNLALIDFSIKENRDSFATTLSGIGDRLKAGPFLAYPIIGGEEISSAQIVESFDPSDTSVIFGRVSLADEAEALSALELLSKRIESVAVNSRGEESSENGWAKRSFAERAKIISSVGDIMERRRLELASLIIREVGKPWKEADGDVCEAIDFCRYYAEMAERLGLPKKLGSIPGEDNRYLYEPRGVAVVIAPWNFPLAIACGMTVAALVTGNATILKPAEQSSIIAFEFAKILLEAGIPGDAFAFLPGNGEVVGRLLVASPLVDLICFTGSRNVGLEIIKQAAVVHPGQRNVKRVIAEMGGKNAIIVDEDADLDEAIKGIIQSAFGYAGQKCSACSRLVVVGDAYLPLLARLKDACGDIIVGEASDPATLLGPVIDKEAKERILKTIDEAESRGVQLLFKGEELAGGNFVPQTIFRDVEFSDPIWKEEIFGPVLACAGAQTFEEAVRIAVDSDYALTGAVFSRSPKNIEYAKENFLVGNLYINRGCTGALVYRQPFGGSRMSGVGSKAGGPDYLIQFLDPRCITENTMRRGFSPDL